MNLFFHHVGQIGAEKDFPKTIYSKQNLDKIILDKVNIDPDLIKLIKSKFPSGVFNCWGVPAGAVNVIKNLEQGDSVLLVERATSDGMVPILCNVKIFWKYELSNLSEYLWGDSKFSYIFFFDTIEIILTWEQLVEDFHYKSNFSPRGNFYKVNPDRLERFNGANSYVNNLLSCYTDHQSEHISDWIIEENPINYNAQIIQNEEIKLQSLTQYPPLLIDENVPEKSSSTKFRNQAFRSLIKKIYNSQCAVCSQQVKSPEGHFAVHAAHIFPKSRNGSDDLRNGICLCFFHHWAFDVGWFNISNNYTIIIREDIPRTSEYQEIFRWENHKINLPKNKDMWPHTLYLTESRKIYGFQP